MAKVLIVDDEVTTRFMIRRFVHDLGHWVIESSNGRRAWDVLWDNRDIDLLITDLMMPELSGQGLIQMVRASADVRKLPIIVITADTEADELDYLAGLGASAFMRKPITPAIRPLIQRVLMPGDLPSPQELVG
ncbi:MAG TPA: response regulator [Polyangiales bacterium]